MEQVYDAAVIGAGVNGSSSALHFAKLGKKTILIEQFPIPHSRGSSGGQTRIIRYANHGHEALSPLMMDSFQKWKNLETETGISLLRPCSLFSISTSLNKKANALLHASIVNAGRQPKYYSGQDFNDEYGTSFAPDSLIMEDCGAGILMADKCVLAIQKRFVALGGKVLDEWTVKAISVSDQGEELIVLKKENDEEVKTRSLVVCAGPWSLKVLKLLNIHLPLRPIKVEVFYWRLKDISKRTFSWFNIDNTNAHFYGLPQLEYPNLVKICYHDGVECDPEERDATPDLPQAREELCRFVRDNFPWILPEPVIHEYCMYTMSPDRQMIIDQHPKYKHIVYGCGFSGSGFKTGLTVGQILTEMALGMDPCYDVSAFKSDRFSQSDDSKSKL